MSDSWKMKNPFRTRKILYIAPKYQLTYFIPFWGEITHEIKKDKIIKNGNLQGNKYDVVVIDEETKCPTRGK